MIRGIVWDLDETLLIEESAVVAAFTRAAELGAERAGVPAADLGAAARQCARARWRASPVYEYCLQVGIASWEGLWAPFEGDEEPIRFLREWAPAYRTGTWSDALAKHGVFDRDLPAAMAETFAAARRSSYDPYPDALDALRAVHGVLPMAVLTNGAPCLQREKLYGAGLGDWFEFVLVSGDIGVGKPDPLPFTVCADRLGVEPAGLLMVGDNYERDIAGALETGFRALWVDRVAAGAPAPMGASPPEPDDVDIPHRAVRVGSLRELDLEALRDGRLRTRA